MRKPAAPAFRMPPAIPMSPVSPLPAVVIVLIAAAIGASLGRWLGTAGPQGRYATIDGLRGYLALFVFLHHSCIWYNYLHANLWAVPSSSLYTHLGQDSVATFFMITGFLFIGKLLDARSKPMDWDRLYVSRLLRLWPLYLAAIAGLVAIVAWLSGGSLRVSGPGLGKSLVKWLTFTVLGAPDINGVTDTYLIIAGVTWSLPYEWFFYLTLPLIGRGLGVRTPIRHLVVGACAVSAFLWWRPNLLNTLSFAGGIAAAAASRYPSVRRLAQTRLSSLAILACVVLSMTVSPSYGYASLCLLSAAFVPIACGNDLFGILTAACSRTLGEMAYSLYLLHGLLLFTLFELVIGRETASAFAPLTHWFAVVALAPVLVLLSALTYRWIERPALARTDAVTGWLRARLRRAAPDRRPEAIG